MLQSLADFKKAGWEQLHQRAMPTEREVEVSGAYDHAHAKLEMLSAIYVEEIQDKVSEMHTVILTMQSFEGRDISPFQNELRKFIRLVTEAEQAIVTKVRRVV